MVAIVALLGGWCASARVNGAEVRLAKAETRLVSQQLVQTANAYRHLMDSLQKENARRARFLRESAKRELVTQRTLDSLLGVAPPALAPASCQVYTMQLSSCQQLVDEVRGQRDTARASQQAEASRADSAKLAARKYRATADSLLREAAKPKGGRWLGVLPKPPVWAIFGAGLILGTQL